jgi:hypothetical protein
MTTLAVVAVLMVTLLQHHLVTAWRAYSTPPDITPTLFPNKCTEATLVKGPTGVNNQLWTIYHPDGDQDKDLKACESAMMNAVDPNNLLTRVTNADACFSSGLTFAFGIQGSTDACPFPSGMVGCNLVNQKSCQDFTRCRLQPYLEPPHHNIVQNYCPFFTPSKLFRVDLTSALAAQDAEAAWFSADSCQATTSFGFVTNTATNRIFLIGNIPINNYDQCKNDGLQRVMEIDPTAKVIVFANAPLPQQCWNDKTGTLDSTFPGCDPLSAKFITAGSDQPDCKLNPGANGCQVEAIGDDSSSTHRHHCALHGCNSVYQPHCIGLKTTM